MISVDTVLVVMFGFAVAGCLASAYHAFFDIYPSFGLLSSGSRMMLVSLPLLFITAPFILARNSLRGLRIERRSYAMVSLSLLLASGWSLMSGTLLLKLLQG